MSVLAIILYFVAFLYGFLDLHNYLFDLSFVLLLGDNRGWSWFTFSILHLLIQFFDVSYFLSEYSVLFFEVVQWTFAFFDLIEQLVVLIFATFDLLFVADVADCVLQLHYFQFRFKIVFVFNNFLELDIDVFDLALDFGCSFEIDYIDGGLHLGLYNFQLPFDFLGFCSHSRQLLVKMVDLWVWAFSILEDGLDADAGMRLRVFQYTFVHLLIYLFPDVLDLFLAVTDILLRDFDIFGPALDTRYLDLKTYLSLLMSLVFC